MFVLLSFTELSLASHDSFGFRNSTHPLGSSQCTRLLDVSFHSGQTTEPTLADRGDLVGFRIRDLHGELLLNSHNNLNGIERVEAEIAGEGSGW